MASKLVVAISSRALFNFEQENEVYEMQDTSIYEQYQLERLEQAAKPGVAYSLIKKLLAFNGQGEEHVEVVILSRNDPVSGLRVFHSGKEHGLSLERGVFTRGRSPFPYLKPLQANLFLSANADDIREALNLGFPAACVYPESRAASETYAREVRIAFDGDAVLFSDEAEQVFQQEGLDAFHAHEQTHIARPLPAGPFKPFLEAVQALQTLKDSPMRLRTALVTARSAPAHERAIRTLMQWKIEVDEAMFLGGLEKGPFLKEFEPDFFFDDQRSHCESGAQAGPTGQVVAGIKNTQTR
ncbi:MAG: 5'-nucleotidase [Pontibacterium sp.]